MSSTTPAVPKEALRRLALVLVWAGEGWNILEAVVALWSGIGASSIALLAFGMDSLIELAAGAVLIWRLSKVSGEGEEEAAERKAHRIIGITFLFLAGYILLQSTATLLGWLAEPRESLIGMALVVSSALVMSVLFLWKSNLAVKLSSRALRAEAVESLVCDLQDLTVLVGLGLNALWGWWWADPLAALALIPFLLKEGWEGVRGEHGEKESKLCWCWGCFYGLRTCRRPCCKAND